MYVKNVLTLTALQCGKFKHRFCKGSLCILLRGLEEFSYIENSIVCVELFDYVRMLQSLESILISFFRTYVTRSAMHCKLSLYNLRLQYFNILLLRQ